LHRLDGLQSKGQQIDMKAYGYVADKHRHLLEALPRLGERMPPRDVTPDLYTDLLPSLARNQINGHSEDSDAV
jgi:hypothetical protein